MRRAAVSRGTPRARFAAARERLGGTLLPRRPAVAAAEIREHLRDAVVHELRGEPARVVAASLGITDRGARDIQQGVSLPRPEHLVLLARLYPAIFAAWLRATEDGHDE